MICPHCKVRGFEEEMLLDLRSSQEYPITEKRDSRGNSKAGRTISNSLYTCPHCQVEFEFIPGRGLVEFGGHQG